MGAFKSPTNTPEAPTSSVCMAAVDYVNKVKNMVIKVKVFVKTDHIKIQARMHPSLGP